MKKSIKDEQVFSLLSMTGLGKGRAEGEEFALSVVIKSVNSRGYEVKYRLPELCAHLEPKLSKIIGENFSRGRIDIFLTLEYLTGKKALSIDEAKLDAIVFELNSVQKRYPELLKALSVRDLLSVPDLFTAPQLPQEEVITSLSESALLAAVCDLKQAKAIEGNNLALRIKAMLNCCTHYLAEIETACKTEVTKRFDRFKARMTELFSHYDINDDRLYQEFALLAERSDFTEEMDRLKAHVQHFMMVCEDQQPKGRKLDFLCQEMLRESNTLMTKAFSHAITIKAIELKADVERIREQVQNIE